MSEFYVFIRALSHTAQEIAGRVHPNKISIFSWDLVNNTLVDKIKDDLQLHHSFYDSPEVFSKSVVIFKGTTESEMLSECIGYIPPGTKTNPVDILKAIKWFKDKPNPTL